MIEKFGLEREQGVALIYITIAFVVFLGIAAFAIDIGYHAVVRNQLQNAADAAALDACNYLYARGPVILPPPPPDWNGATVQAEDAVTINTADNKSLSEGDIVTGWWDITQTAMPDQWSTSIPSGSTPPSADCGPAVRITIAKTANTNNGPVSTFFGGIFGSSSLDNAASATAVKASPGSIIPGAMPPVAISKEAADQYQNYYDEEHFITIGSPYHYPNGLAGQWTSMFEDFNDVPSVRDLIESGNPAAVSIGDQIWLQPGVKDNLYDQNNQPSIDTYYAGKTVVFPVINAVIEDNTHSWVTIDGFVGFHILCAGKGCDGEAYDPDPSKKNEAVIVGYFTTEPVYGTGPIGPHYGPLDRCRLCQ